MPDMDDKLLAEQHRKLVPVMNANDEAFIAEARRRAEAEAAAACKRIAAGDFEDITDDED